MKPLIHALAVLAVSTAASSETVRFTDGTEIEVASYEIQEHVVVLLTADGKLRSVPKSMVRLDALTDEEAMVNEAIELVGLRRLTDEIAVSARRAGADTSELLADAMSEGFAADRIYRVAEAAFRAEALGVRLGAALEFLRSPMARRMERAATVGAGTSLESYVDSLEAEPPTADRVELLMRLDRASGTSEAAVEIQAAMMSALFQSMVPSGPDTQHLVEQAVEEARPKLARRTRNRIQLSLHYMYRDVSDAELLEYVSYLESENGEWLSRVLLKSLFAAMEEGARRSGEVIAERLKELSKIQA